MNYSLHYDRLIENARLRCILPGVYSEEHHIIPRCLGGDNSEDNLIDLFPEEHFVAHQLLVKMHPGNPKLAFALIIMTGDKKNTPRRNKAYGWIKQRISEARRGRRFNEESKKKMSESAKKRKPMSEETKAKLRGPRTNKRAPATEETKRKISETKKAHPKSSWNKGVPCSEETKQKLSEFYRVKREATHNLK